MKLTELIAEAQKALQLLGDIEVCQPCPDEGVDGDICGVTKVKIRRRGSPDIPPENWTGEDRQKVFVLG